MDLPPGYYAERGETGIYLMDSDKRQVMKLPGEVDFEEPQGPRGWQELCSSLLIQLSQRTAECDRLRRRVAKLDEQLDTTEAELDRANAITELLYEFFRKHSREVAERKTRPTHRGTG